MRDRLELPTKAQISAITEPHVLRDLLDDIERTTTSIETQLEFDVTDDDEWYTRARGALIVHRIAAKMITRRLGALKASGVRTSAAWGPAPKRDPDENRPLTNELLASPPVIDVYGLPDEAAVSAKLLWIVEAINAVEADRTSEVGVPAAQRDEGFLAATKGALKILKAIRIQLESRRGTMKHREKAAALAEIDSRRERLFVDAAREVLPRETFLALWERVDRLAPRRVKAAA